MKMKSLLLLIVALFAIDETMTAREVNELTSTYTSEDVGVNSNVNIGEEDVPL